MSKKLFAVQETDRPFGPTEKAHGFETVSEHTTLGAARKAARKLEDEMHKRCGQAAWDSNRRIIALISQEMRMVFDCIGTTAYGWHGCENWAQDVRTYMWEAGEPEPYFGGCFQCANCQKIDYDSDVADGRYD